MSKTPRTSKANALLSDPDVRRWHQNLARGSDNTAETYLRNFQAFLEATHQTPQGFLALPPKERDNLLADHLSQMVEAGKSGGFMKCHKSAVVSWLDWNGQKLGRKLKISNAGVRVNVNSARIQDQEGFRRVMDAADARGRSALAMLAYAGLRPHVMGNRKGLDGLRFKHFTEAHLTPEGLVFDKVPTRLDIPAHLSKTKRPWFTFLGPEGCEYVAAMVKERLQRGEALTPESAVIAPKGHRPFMSSLSISGVMRVPMRAAGLSECPYINRSYFGSRCMLAQTEGFLWDWKEFCMGHKGNISAVYALHKQLPPDTVEAMREGYTVALQYLETRQTGARKDPWRDMVSALLGVAGVPESQTSGLNLSKLTPDEVVALVKDQAVASLKPAQRIVQATDLESLILKGWRFVTNLGDGRFVVEGTA